MTNVSLERAQYRRWDQSRNWDQYQNRPRNWTLDNFVCVAQNPLGTVRRHMKLQLAGTGLYWCWGEGLVGLESGGVWCWEELG